LVGVFRSGARTKPPLGLEGAGDVSESGPPRVLPPVNGCHLRGELVVRRVFGGVVCVRAVLGGGGVLCRACIHVPWCGQPCRLTGSVGKN
jgi:hypothetical protein